MRRRVLVPVVLALALGATQVDPSRGQAPADGRASATLVTGAAGAFGEVGSTGERTGRDGIEVDAAGVTVADGELAATGAGATAEATAVARSVSLLDGLVTAYGVRRRVVDGPGGRVYSGRIDGLKLDGRLVGDVAAERRYTIEGVATVVVNRGGVALRVRLLAPRGGVDAGESIAVATVRARAGEATSPAPTPTPTHVPTPAAAPTPTATPQTRTRRPPRRRLSRRRAPEIAERLTADRFAFPVYGPAADVADDFGAARQIGAHQGNDVFAPFGAPVLAVSDGELLKVGTLPISGNRLWLRSDAGDEFFYAHLSAFSPAAVNGRRVRAGEVLGFTGNTGDAEPTPPHVHFEIHPVGGDAIDPHAILRAWQTRRDVPAGAWLARYGSDTDQRPGALVEVRDFIAGE